MFSRAGINFSLILTSGAFLYIILTLLWGINKGFDLMDEGFYLLLSQHIHQYPLMSYFAFWLACIPAFTVNRVLDFRYAQVFCQMFSALVLAYAYLRALVQFDILRDRKLLIACGILSVFGNLLLFAKFPFSISYNSLTGLFLFCATALIIHWSPFDKPFYIRVTENSKQLLFAGILAGLCFSIKFPASAVYILSALILISMLSGRAWFRSTTEFLLGVFLSLIPMFTLIFNPAECWNTTKFFLTYQAHHQTQHSSLAVTYWNSIISVLAYFQPFLIPTALTVFASFFFLARSQSNHKRWTLTSDTLQITTWCILIFELVQKDCLHHNLYTANCFLFICVVIFCQISGFYLGQERDAAVPFRWRVCVLHLELFFLPVICAVGTSNSLAYQCTIYLAATFLLMIGMSATLSKQIRSALPITIVLIVCSVLSVFQFYDGFVGHPYALSSRLNTQTEPVHCKNLRGLRLTASYATFIEKTQQILRANGFKDDDDILAFYHLPGLVFALNGNSPGLGWYVPFPASREWNKYFLEKLTLAHRRKLFLLTGWRLDSTVISGLKSAGLQFPSDFKLIGSLHSPLNLGGLDGVPDHEYLNGRIDIYQLTQK